jgi:hypothetical protein
MFIHARGMDAQARSVVGLGAKNCVLRGKTTCTRSAVPPSTTIAVARETAVQFTSYCGSGLDVSPNAVEISAWLLLLLLLLVLPSKATWQSCDTRLSPRHGQ